MRSAEAVVDEFRSASGIQITYCVEPRQNISLARNKAIENAKGDFVAFIDDDEFPTKRWILTLFEACEKFSVDGSIGPVMRHFDVTPPDWVVTGNFYQRPTYPTGQIIDWSMGRTNNVLIKAAVIPADEPAFRPEFRSGEDQDFFRRVIQGGRSFVWCNEAIVYEVVPPIRWKRSFMLRRALLQGTVSVLHPSFGAIDVVKSLVAIPAYSLAAPLAALRGQHVLIKVLIKLSPHIGTLLGSMKINVIKDPYVTE
jgi:glycosyltransferase involved in cell wall biosynthesis